MVWGSLLSCSRQGQEIFSLALEIEGMHRFATPVTEEVGTVLTEGSVFVLLVLYLRLCFIFPLLQLPGQGPSIQHNQHNTLTLIAQKQDCFTLSI